MTPTSASTVSPAVIPARREPLRLAPAWSTPPAAPPPQASPHSTPPKGAAAPTLPIAAVRLPGRRFDEVRTALRGAGFGVLDILAQDIGPVPSVLVLELPHDEEAVARLLAVARPGVGRVLLTRDRRTLEAQPLRVGLDEVIDAHAHPLQVAASALRASGTSEYRLACWAEFAFEDVSFPCRA